MPQHPDAERGWRQHRLELDNAVVVASGELAKIVRANPDASLDEIAAIFHGVANKFRPIAAASAFRALENSRHAYGFWNLPDPEAAEPLQFAQARATTGWALWNAQDARHEAAAQHLPELVGSLGRSVRGGARDTIFRSAKRAKTLYARVPGVKACWFCLMLASRGAEYTSRESAGIVQNRKSKRYGMGFHDHCDCLVIESYTNADLPNLLHDLRDEWQAVAGWATHHDLTPEQQRKVWKKHVGQTRPMGYAVREVLDDGTAIAYPRGDSIKRSDRAWNHIFQGDNKGGGHLHGVRPAPGSRKAWFPDDWDERRIRRAVDDVLSSPRLVQRNHVGYTFYGEVDRVRVKVRVYDRDGLVTAHPIDGDGVVIARVPASSPDTLKIKPAPYGASVNVQW